MIALAGAQAIATTSGIAWSLGRCDGQRLTRAEMIQRIREIVAAVGIPVTADIEGGYGSGPEDVALTAEAVIAAGAVGVNIGDSHPPGGPLSDPAEQAERMQIPRKITEPSALQAGLDWQVQSSFAKHLPNRLNVIRGSGALHKNKCFGLRLRQVSGHDAQGRAMRLIACVSPPGTRRHLILG